MSIKKLESKDMTQEQGKPIMNSNGHHQQQRGSKACIFHLDDPPREPVDLMMCMGETWKFSKVVARISSHICKCQRYVNAEMDHSLKCQDRVCDYFGWYYCHYNQCSAKNAAAPSCPHCQSLVRWIHSHATSCAYDSGCVLAICRQIQKQWLRRNMKQFSTDATRIVTPSSAEYHPLRRRSDEFPKNGATSEAITTNGFDQRHQFSSGAESSRSVLVGQPTVMDQSDQSDISLFQRSASGSSANSLKLAPRRRPPPRGNSEESVSSSEDPGDIFHGCRRNSAEKNGYGIADQEGTIVEPMQRMHSGSHSKVVVGDDSFQTQDYLRIFQGGGDRTQSMSSSDSQSPSPLSSGLVSSMELSAGESDTESGLQSHSDTMSTLTGTEHTASGPDSISTPTGPQTRFPPRPTDLLDREQVAAAMATVDAVREQNRYGLQQMKCRAALLKQEPPTGRVQKEDAIGAMLYDAADFDGDCICPVDPLPKEHQRLVDEFEKAFAPGYEKQAREMLSKPFEENEEMLQEDLAYRDSIREYLQGQFNRHQVYREGLHWDRLWRLGNGGQSTCYTIADKQTNSLLALKEGDETDKTVDEAYICLKLSCLSKYEPPNIVEYFGAAMLPLSPQRGLVQLFLELMPTCMQGYIFKNGPLCCENVHNFASQLFEAVDFLHNKLKIVHCDIKPANVLVDYNQQRVKLADFGCAELLEECHLGPCFRGNEKAGTLAYNPPEYYSDKRCSFAFDIWQAGCTVLAMLTGKRPWRNLFMDCADPQGKASHRVIRMKGLYRMMISQQTAHMLPSFVGESLQQLLFGCIHSDSSHRLSAQDCSYLLATAEAKTPEQQEKVLEVFGHSRSHEVLLDYRPPPPSVDVYLGSLRHNACIRDLQHVLMGGWLGTVPYHEGMTYADVRQRISPTHFPVSKYFGDYQLAVSENQPQGIWRTINGYGGGVGFAPVSEHSLVDRTKAVVIQVAGKKSDKRRA